MHKIKRSFTYLFLGVASVVSIFPFLWMIISSTNKSVDVTKGKLLPGTHFMENFRNLIETTNLTTALLNSAKIAIITTILALIIASLAGYGFQIYRSRLRDTIYNIILLSMMIPFAAIMIPLYRLFAQISGVTPGIGIDTLPAVILPTMTTAFLIFFFRQSTKMFPKDMLEAGRIDGLSELGVFIRIFMPTMKTTYAAAAIITFMSSWNSYLWPLIVLQTPENITASLLISNLGAGYAPDYGVIMMSVVIVTIPSAAVFFIMQKHFVAGMMGSVKG